MPLNLFGITLSFVSEIMSWNEKMWPIQKVYFTRLSTFKIFLVWQAKVMIFRITDFVRWSKNKLVGKLEKAWFECCQVPHRPSTRNMVFETAKTRLLLSLTLCFQKLDPSCQADNDFKEFGIVQNKVAVCLKTYMFGSCLQLHPAYRSIILYPASSPLPLALVVLEWKVLA